MDEDTFSDPRETSVELPDETPGPRAEAAGPVPDSIGGYRIVRRIATGGMGAVYEARQDSPSRSVALKVIRPGRASPANLRRFEHEAEVLGRLHHAGIAQVYEAGAADTGYGPQPFFAMEYIDGEALTVYANRHELAVRDRLELICKVCDAVEHAHQKGVIHRDLKPSNILVGSDGQPKILDFGVARSIDADVQATMMTRTGELVGTLSYMSPEQVAGDPGEIDTRSDVYALGVLAFELLADQMPYPLAGRGITEIARIIREREPTWLGHQRPALRGDVETIVAKALEKDKPRRYQSVAEMAADIRRHLADEPIVARPPSLTYQFGKFARRHRAAVAAGVVALAALLIGLVGATYGLLEARREAARAAGMNEFLLQGLLTAAVPDNAFGPDVLVVDVLGRARATLGDRFAGEPEIEADLALALAQSYIGLSVYDEAADLAERARQLRTELYGAADPRTLDASHEAAAIRLALGDYEAAYSGLGEVWELRARALGPHHEDTLTSRSDMADSLWRLGDAPAAIAMKREVLEIRRRVLGDDHDDTIAGMSGLAVLLSYDGQYDASEALFNEALARLEAAGDRSPRTIRALQGLSQLYWFRNQNDEARAAAERAIEAASAVYGEDHPAAAESMTNLAFALRREREYAAAEELLAAAYEIFLLRYGPQSEVTTTGRHNLANIIADQGRIDEAEPIHLANLEHRRRENGPEHPLVAQTLGGMGTMYNRNDQYDRAAESLREALGIYRLTYDDDHPEIGTTLSNLAFALRNGERWAEAAEVLRELMVIDTRQLGRTHEWVLDEYEDLVEVLSAAGDFEAAESYALERLEITDAEMTPDDDAYWRSKLLLGRLYFEHRRYADAEPLMLEAFAGYGPDHDVEDPNHEDTISWLAELYTDWGRPDEAARYRAMLGGGGPG